MKHIYSLITATTLCFASAMAVDFGGVQTGGNIDSYRSEKNVDYVGDGITAHKCDIYFPNDNQAKHPVLIHIYGSAWGNNDGKGAADLGTVGAAALANGYVFVAPNHRKIGETIWPGHAHDIKACIRYLRGNAEKLGIDTSFVAISGFSSGGHLASVMGTTRNVKTYTGKAGTIDLEGTLGNYTDFSSSVDAVVDWSGPVDLLNMECGNGMMMNPLPETQMVGCNGGRQQCWDELELLSAQTYIDPTDPPFMVAHGSGDFVVAQCVGQKFARDLEAGGVYTETYWHSGGHGVEGSLTGNMIQFLAKARADKASGNGNGNGNQGNNQGGGNNGDCDEKENFQVYLAFGQSNMYGNAPVEEADKVVNPRIKKMITVNGNDLYDWVDGIPPYAVKNAGANGYSMCDKFARTLADNTDEKVNIGIICVAIPGTSIKAFDESQYQAYLNDGNTADWLRNYANSYGGNPYKRLLDCAKKAQETGVIKGMIFHQGESDWGYGEWADVVAKIYKSLCKDLGLSTDETGFVLGELVGGAGTERVQAVKSKISLCEVVETDDLGPDPTDEYKQHFAHSGYEVMGVRYAEAMQRLVSMDACGGNSTPKVSTPYGGTAASIPGRIEAENYDEGGSRVGWYDLSAGNSCDSNSNVYRSDDVDIKKEGQDYIVGFCQKGEWMKYTVNVKKTGEYTLNVRVGEGGESGKFSLKMDDGSINYTVNVKSTGTWGTFAEQPQTAKFNLTEGEHVLTLTIEQDWVDIDWIEFKADEASVKTVATKQIMIVPNPANGVIEVMADGEVESIAIYNMVGEMVAIENGTRADVSAMGDGVYVVKAIVDGEAVMQRIVVKK